VWTSEICVEIAGYGAVILRWELLEFVVAVYTGEIFVDCVAAVAEVGCPSAAYTQKLYFDAEVVGEGRDDVVGRVEFEA
jgi:hypothetical protein